ncbi:helix-turn-helix domain-containing protein [soil metagenome]
MIYRRSVPRPPLSDFVKLLWLFEKPSPSHGSERVLPTGTVELVINLGDSSAGGFEAIVAGPHSRFFVLDTSQPSSVIGAHFRPGGVSAFLDLPVDELRNLHVPLEALWGRRAAELRERLLATAGVEERLALLERSLLAQLDRRHSSHAAIGHALAAFGRGPRRIADVVDETGLSPRRFIRLFSDEVGLTPKVFCRVRRFQNTVALLHGVHEVDWAETAAACGYYDQSHMIHDFRDFAGLSPARYLARRAVHMNHVPQ